ncbi:hypothetical protein [Haloglycomyces albus]|uniref:hypothetical protein n=1 Tax=Haloglycomyces albus TaxID=526067 RepID=UPI00046D45F6|nr:hypothetical protein [Haloglycomyces albus]
MKIGGTNYYPVEASEEQLADLHEKNADWWGSKELGEYGVNELGLTPPKLLADGSPPAITGVWLADDDRMLLVWGLHFEEGDPKDGSDVDVSEGWDSNTVT